MIGDWGMWLVCAGINFGGGYIFRMAQEHRKKIKFLTAVLGERKAPWQKLPSGYSRSSGECIGYVMPLEGQAYWWVTRKSRTIMEGPAKTLDIGQKEVESALKEFA